MHEQSQLTSCSIRPFSRFRRGLAPVELVLSIPILLMIMALMVTFGSAACWKIRSQTVSRDAVWRTRAPRPNYLQPRPDVWPDSEGMSHHRGDDLVALDDDSLKLPVVSGPLGSVTVDDRRLDFQKGVRVGRANLDRPAAMMPALGPIEFDVGTPIIEDKFQYREMGLSSNWLRRIPRIYEMPEVASLVSSYEQSVRAVENSPSRYGWMVLDRDEELRNFHRHYIDFHPRMSSFCETDIMVVSERHVPRLQARVENVPRNMTRTFMRMYESLLALDPFPPYLNRGELERKLEQLRQFEETLE